MIWALIVSSAAPRRAPHRAILIWFPSHTRIPPVLIPSEAALADQMAEFNISNRTEVMKDNRLSPEELGLLAERLATASNPVEAAEIKERLTRGFYGV